MVRISFGIPLEPSDPAPDSTFDEIKRSEDFHTWQGNACTLPLPGNGKQLSEGKSK